MILKISFPALCFLVNELSAQLIVFLLLLLLPQIMPQAICTRYGLSVGAKAAPVVRLLLILFFPVAYPISKVRTAAEQAADLFVVFERASDGLEPCAWRIARLKLGWDATVGRPRVGYRSIATWFII